MLLQDLIIYSFDKENWGFPDFSYPDSVTQLGVGTPSWLHRLGDRPVLIIAKSMVL